jgi:hypothetical protein
MACVGSHLFVTENKRGELWRVSSAGGGEFVQEKVLDGIA